MTTHMTSAAIKDCDIRGRFPEEVNEALFLHLGKVFGRQVTVAVQGVPVKGTVVVGCDDRPSTPALKKSFLTGLTSHNLRITDLGVVPTPVVYWAKERVEAQASAIITASHNPPEFNGLKVMNGTRPPTPDVASSACLLYWTRGQAVSPVWPPRYSENLGRMWLPCTTIWTALFRSATRIARFRSICLP